MSYLDHMNAILSKLKEIRKPYEDSICWKNMNNILSRINCEKLKSHFLFIVCPLVQMQTEW